MRERGMTGRWGSERERERETGLNHLWFAYWDRHRGVEDAICNLT